MKTYFLPILLFSSIFLFENTNQCSSYENPDQYYSYNKPKSHHVKRHIKNYQSNLFKNQNNFFSTFPKMNNSPINYYHPKKNDYHRKKKNYNQKKNNYYNPEKKKKNNPKKKKK